MKLQGTFTVRAPREAVYAFLLDPRRLSECVEDPHTLEMESPDRFRGTLRAGVGPVRGTFSWAATVAERVPMARARIKVHGSGLGSAFDVDSTVDLEDAAGLTTARWQAEVTLSGSLASLGARLMQSTIDRKTNAVFDNIRERLEAS